MSSTGITDPFTDLSSLSTMVNGVSGEAVPVALGILGLFVGWRVLKRLVGR